MFQFILFIILFTKTGVLENIITAKLYMLSYATSRPNWWLNSVKNIIGKALNYFFAKQNVWHCRPEVIRRRIIAIVGCYTKMRIVSGDSEMGTHEDMLLFLLTCLNCSLLNVSLKWITNDLRRLINCSYGLTRSNTTWVGNPWAAHVRQLWFLNEIHRCVCF